LPRSGPISSTGSPTPTAHWRTYMYATQLRDVDGDHVHGDAAYERCALAIDEDWGAAGEVACYSISVAGGDDGDFRVVGRPPGASIAHCFAFDDLARGNDRSLEAHDRVQSQLGAGFVANGEAP